MSNGFVYPPVGLSTKDEISRKPLSHGVLTTKAAIQRFLASFFDTTGPFRSMLVDQCPQINQYITDKTFRASGKDISKRQMQLARFFDQIRQHLPAILIQSSSPQFKSSGLGEIRSSRMVDGKRLFEIDLNLTMSITLSVGAQDESSFELIANSLALIFGTLRRFAGGNFLHSPRNADNWEVLLPLEFSLPEGAGTNIGDDPTEQMWAGTMSLEGVRFEGITWVEVPIGLHDPNALPLGSYGASVDCADIDALYPTVIDAPDRIQANSSAPLFISRMRPGARIVIDDPKILSVSADGTSLRPRRLGTTTIRVVDEKSTSSNPVQHAEHTITVVY